jgi:hypothetical protein
VYAEKERRKSIVQAEMRERKKGGHATALLNKNGE